LLIDHVNLKADSELLEELKDFYCEFLGLQEGFRPEFSAGGYWLYAGDRALVHLSESDVHHPGESAGCFDHFALRSTGLHSLLEKLRSKDIHFQSYYLPEMNMTQIFVKDPAGTRVEVSFINETID